MFKKSILVFTLLTSFNSAAAVITAIAEPGTATTLSYTADTGAFQSTNFTDQFLFPQFDDLSGTLTLTNVKIDLTASVNGVVGVENKDVTAQNVYYNLAATVKLLLGVDTLVTSLPTVNGTFAASAYDGVDDKAGTSGITYSDLSGGPVSENINYTTSLSAYIGTGNISTDLQANAGSFGNGPGNLSQEFATNAKALATITYTFENSVIQVSEPSSLAILGASLLAFGLIRRRTNRV